jgi:hypothetical protein
MERYGIPVQNLRGWKPGRKEIIALKKAVSIVDRLKYSNGRPSDQLLKEYQDIFIIKNLKWITLKSLADTFLISKGILSRDGYIQSQDGSKVVIAKMDGMSPLISMSLPSVKKAKTSHPNLPKRKALKRLDAQSLSLASINTFNPKSDTISIYIDEAWPGNADPEKDKSIGVIGGLIWDGDQIDPAILPLITTHQRFSSTNIEAIGNVIACKMAFPFIMPLKVFQGTAQRQYFEVVINAIKILLGWMLPQKGKQCNVRILMERHSSFSEGTDLRGYFNGIFDEAKQSSPGRFHRWIIQDIHWTGKNEEYVPYADSIAYLSHEHTAENKFFAQKARYRKWPGYLPVNLELVPRLMRLDQIEQVGNDDDILL